MYPNKTPTLSSAPLERNRALSDRFPYCCCFAFSARAAFQQQTFAPFSAVVPVSERTSDFVDYCLVENSVWFEAISEHATYVVKEYIKSRSWKKYQRPLLEAASKQSY